jgi:hypothetical protein
VLAGSTRPLLVRAFNLVLDELEARA